MNRPIRALPLLALLIAAPLAAQELRQVGFRGFFGGVYDPVRERVIVPDPGGYSHEWDGTSWSRVPDAGARPGFCYREAGDGRLVTVNQSYWGTGPVFEMFERIGHEWQPKVVAGGPMDRWGVAAAYDMQRGELVAFGGYDPTTGLSLAETWTFDGTSWQQHSVPAPPARHFASAAYDSARQRVVMFGGGDSNFMTDTWEWDGASWTQVATSVSPPGRDHAQMCFDSTRGVVIMAGGTATGGASLDVWEYDGTSWTLQPSPTIPAGNWFGSLVHDEARGETLMLGVTDTATLRTGIVQAWDGVQWSAKPGFGMHPTLGYFESSSADHTGTLVLRLSSSNVFNPGISPPLLAWDGSQWHTLSTSGPSPRGSTVMWPMSTATYVFGGADAGQVFAETWRWDGANWAQLSPAVSPPARVDAAAVYHPTAGVGIVFGGSASGAQYGALGDTWSFDGSNWQQLTNGPQPGARRFPAMAYDPIRDRVVMSGGEFLSPFPGGSTIYDDTWEHDGTSWTQVMVTGGPVVNLNSRMTMAFDASRQKVVAVVQEWFGYVLWEYDGASWTQFSVAGDVYSQHPLTASQPLACTGPNGNLVVTDIQGVLELLPNPSSAESYGSACTTAAPQLLASELPDIGRAGFAVEATLAPANGLVAIAAGNQSANQPVLGCTLLVQPITTALLVADPQGFVAQSLPLPANPALLGGEFFFQAAVLDGTAPAGISLSRGLRIALGQ